MKFSCDRCGKKYATAEAPAPGRVYKLKCKACGHLIVVKTPPAGPAVTPSPARPTRDEPVSRAPAQQEVEVEIEQPPASDAAPFQFQPSSQVPSSAGEPTAEISMFPSLEGTPPAAEGGYVDIFADSAPAAPEPPVVDDPFLKAARGSLPDNFAGRSLKDPFADMRAELDASTATDAATDAAAEPPRPTGREVPPPSAFAPPPRASDDKKKSGLPVALIGIGFAVVVGIVVSVALSGKKTAPAAPTPPPVAAPVQPPPAPVAAPAPAPEPKKAEPARAEPEPKPRARREEPREERKREEKKVTVAKAEPRPKPPPPPPKPEPKVVAKTESAKPVELPDAASALSPPAVQKVVNGSRRAFESCIEQAARKGTDTKFDGRTVALRLNVNPNGFVTYPTLDDVTLNRTDLGECLKAAARLMVFPKFQGDVFHVEVPLRLSGG